MPKPDRLPPFLLTPEVILSEFLAPARLGGKGPLFTSRALTKVLAKVSRRPDLRKAEEWALAPLVYDPKGAMGVAASRRAVLAPYKPKGPDRRRYANLVGQLKEQVAGLKPSAGARAVPVFLDYLALSAACDLPLVMLEGSESPFMRFGKWLNHQQHVLHKPPLFKLVRGDKALAQRGLEYLVDKRKALTPLITSQNRGAIVWLLTKKLLLGHVLGMPPGVLWAVSGLTFLVYDP